MVVLISVTIVPMAMIGTALGIVLFTPVPVTVPEAKVIPRAEPSTVFDSLGRPIAVFRQFDSKVPVAQEDIPNQLKLALITMEDRSFYSHDGVSLRGTVRALVKNVQAGETEQGASTLTMQYVKNVLALDEATPVAAAPGAAVIQRPERGFIRKLREAIIANRVDREVTKDDIMFGYLSNVYFGQGAYGVGAAARTYFQKPVKNLSLSEAATLVGIIPSPSRFDPRANLRTAESKRVLVLQKMLEQKHITQQEHDEAAAQILWRERDGEPPEGQPVTLVFDPPRVETKYPYFVDYVRRYMIARYGEDALYRGGLQITTTLVPDLQAKAEETAAATLKGTNRLLETSIVAIEPSSGYVKALVGGRDFNAPDGQVNLALGFCPSIDSIVKRIKHEPRLAPTCITQNDISGGGSGRSPGSSMKPFVLAAAFEEGIPPTEIIDGSVYRVEGCRSARGCSIQNYEGGGTGPVDLRTATVKSINTAYARLGLKVGIRKVASMMQRLGVTSAWYDPDVHGASYSIGGVDVSPLEMAAAYSVFANRGIRQPATPVIVVTDADQRIIEDNTSRPGERVLSENVADNINSVLQGVVDSGTGVRAQLTGRPVAGKTGTSQNYGNAWFVGYTPQLAVSVWLGYKDAPRPLRGIKGVRAVAGGTIPAQTWAAFMRRALENEPVIDFTSPEPIKRQRQVESKLELQRRARGGIDPGKRRVPQEIGVHSFVEGGSTPAVDTPADDEANGYAPLPETPATVVPLLEGDPVRPAESVPSGATPGSAPPVVAVPEPAPIETVPPATAVPIDPNAVVPADPAGPVAAVNP